MLGASAWPTLDRVLHDAGFHWSATVIWVKDRFVLGQSQFQRRYEPIWYEWRANGKSSFQKRRDLDDVWELPRPARSPHHPTTKPVELVERAIEASSEPGTLVLDPFMGSGSTFIACERTGRIGAGIEIDPVYCDVSVARWESFTGLTAEKADAASK